MNKAGAPELLRSWRSGSKAQPLDLYVGQRRVAHFRNVLFKVSALSGVFVRYMGNGACKKRAPPWAKNAFQCHRDCRSSRCQ